MDHDRNLHDIYIKGFLLKILQFYYCSTVQSHDNSVTPNLDGLVFEREKCSLSRGSLPRAFTKGHHGGPLSSTINKSIQRVIIEKHHHQGPL